jgi:replicative DNA helicase
MNLDTFRNLEIEQSILGCMISDIKSILAIENSSINSDDFYMNKHKILFDAIKQTYKEQQQFDIVLLVDYLKNKNTLEKVDGITYISELANSVVSTVNINVYIDILIEYSCKRKIMDLKHYIEKNSELDNEVLKNEIHKRVLNLFEIRKALDEMRTHGESFIYLLEKRARGETTEIKTGLFALDDIIGGLGKSELITLFAFSSVGKTTLALQMAINAMKQNKKVLFFSLEMSEEQLIERLNANLCSISSKDLRIGNLKDNDWAEVTKATDYLCNNGLLKICRNNTLDEIIAKIQLEKLKSNVDVVFIDYIGLIETPREERRDLQIANITRKLKQLSGSANIPIVILAQAKQSTNGKNGGSYKPHEKISETDIGESGAIYKDSDKVIAMYRNIELDDPIARKVANDEGKLNYNSKDATYNPDCVNLLVKKCRNGTKGTLAFSWEGRYYRIRNYER